MRYLERNVYSDNPKTAMARTKSWWVGASRDEFKRVVNQRSGRFPSEAPSLTRKKMASRQDVRKPIPALKIRRPVGQAGANYASVALGGTSVYGASESEIMTGIGLIQDHVKEVLSTSLIVTRPMIEDHVRQASGYQLKKRLVGAVLGKVLREGDGLVVPILKQGRSLKWLYQDPGRARDFAEKSNRLRERLQSSPFVTVRTAHRILSQEGDTIVTQTDTRHLLEHLVYRGHAVQLDENSFIWPREVERAVDADL